MLLADRPGKSMVVKCRTDNTRLFLSVILFRCSLLLAGAIMLGGCTADAGSAEQRAAEADNHLWFTDVTEAAGLGGFIHETGAEGEKLFPESMGSGCAFIDYDGDGWLDILLAGGGTWPGGKKDPVPPIWLYRNNGVEGSEPGQTPTFTLTTEAAGLADVRAYSNGFAVADYDNDGDQDFYLTTIYENMLFRNDGGVFTEVGRTSGTAGDSAWSTSALFFDADRDGWLDLYVANYVEWTPETDLVCKVDGINKDYCTPQTYKGVPGRYYHNNGDGTFTDLTQEAGFLPSPGKSLGVAELDFNRDGWIDLMVSNDTEPNHLFVNNGDGTFTDRAVEAGVAYDEAGKTRAGMGIDVGVVDSTGEVTVFIGHFSREVIGVYRYIGNGLFVDRSASSKIGSQTMMTLTFGLFLIDVELDGDLDLFTANGHVQPDIEKIADNIGYAEPVHLFINRGDGTFEDAAPTVGGILQKAIVARGSAYGDYDRDGDVDILISENAGPAYLWRNEVNIPNYLRVHVEGRQSNRDAFGTRLVAYVGDHWMERRVRSGSSYMSSSEQAVTFGLGSRQQVDSLVVYWLSGRVDRFTNLAAGQDLVLVEGSDTMTSVAAPGRMHTVSVRSE